MDDDLVTFREDRERPEHVSRAKVDTARGEIVTHDSSLDFNKEKVWQFLETWLTPPTFLITVEGYQNRQATRWVDPYNDGGHYEQYTESVCDFKLNLNMTEFLEPTWNSITPVAIRPNSLKTVDQVIEEYVSNKSIKKWMCCKKYVEWDFDEVKTMINTIVRSTGYKHEVRISQYCSSNRWIEIRSGNIMSKLIDNQWMNCLCLMTGIGCCICALISNYEYRVSNDLYAEFPMTIEPMEFYQRYYWTVYNAACNRS